MKKFLFYFGYLIAFFRLALPYIAPVFIVFFFYSMSQDPSDNGFGSFMFWVSLFVSFFYYIRLGHKKTANNTDSSVEKENYLWKVYRGYFGVAARYFFIVFLGYLILLLTVRFG